MHELLLVHEIAKRGSIHAAARSLRAKQSSVSRSLKLLEDRLGERLFQRASNGVCLTQAGSAFVREAEMLLDSAAGLYARMRRWSCGESGIVSIGVQDCVPPGRISSMLEPHRLAFPDTAFIYRDGARKHLLHDVKNGAIDFAITTLPFPPMDVSVVALWSDRVLVLTPSDHRLAKQRAISWNDLRGEHLLVGKDNAGRELSELLRRKTGVEGCDFPLHRLAVRNLRTVALVANGEGIGLLPEGWLGFLPVAIKEKIAAVAMIDADGFCRFDYGAVWRPETCSTVARKTLTFLEQRIRAP